MSKLIRKSMCLEKIFFSNGNAGEHYRERLEREASCSSNINRTDVLSDDGILSRIRCHVSSTLIRYSCLCDKIIVNND